MYVVDVIRRVCASCKVFGVGRLAKCNELRMLLGVLVYFKAFGDGRIAKCNVFWMLLWGMFILQCVWGG